MLNDKILKKFHFIIKGVYMIPQFHI